MCLDGSMKYKDGSDAKWIQVGMRETLDRVGTCQAEKKLAGVSVALLSLC